MLTQEVAAEIIDWGLTVHHTVTEVDGLYTMNIVVEHGDRQAFSICLDGWSGNILTQEMKLVSFCPSLAVVRDTFHRAMATYLEKATA